jgi:hypothetical protein
MAEWFFTKKSKGEVERDPAWSVQYVCPVVHCRSKAAYIKYSMEVNKEAF